ncbi:DUF6507 family protein [Streptomyces gamaensis]|uniref:DUF6507 family protein n=1 Tax=Streptomyces gamaensis TaxID=1763542 RepID=A0ABW0Z9W8_9ACTN
MTAWDISPSGVRGVLQRCGKEAADMGEAGGKIQESVTDAGSWAGTIAEHSAGVEGPVGTALKVFFGKSVGDLAYVANRTKRSLDGAVDATTAYVEGDLKMAADAQHEAVKEPPVDLPGQGGGHGASTAGGGGR